MTSRRRRAAARRREKHSSSPYSGELEFLSIGRLLRPHGVRGELLMRVDTDFPERIKPGILLFIGEEYQPMKVTGIRKHSRGLLIQFNEYSQREDVDHLRNQPVFVRVEDRPPLPEGEYYYHQLIGLHVTSDEGKEIGVLASILETGANDVYVVVREDGSEVLLPAIDEVILDIDLEIKKMRVHILPGLISD
jgi:16S rRNA processing protein RimM